MNIQIEKIILWPKNASLERRELEFTQGQVNVIHGLSQTGKSAIIHIIDYCLCSSENRIPMGTIRDSVEWFGVLLKIDNEKILLARKNLEKTKFKMYFERSESIKIPDIPEEKFQDKEELKKHINNLMNISFFEEEKGGKFSSRASFRDLVAFNFQPQSIVANANALFYKSEIADYRERLKKIFGIALGIETPQNMYNRIIYESLVKELERLKKEYENHKKFFQDKLFQYRDIIYKAKQYGIINYESLPNDAIGLTMLLEEISKKNIKDMNFSVEGNEQLSKQIIAINNQLQPLYSELRDYESTKKSIMKIIDLCQNNLSLENEKVHRLSIAKFIREFCDLYPQDTSIIQDVDTLCNNIEELENKNFQSQKGLSRYFEEKRKLDEEIEKVSQQINELVKLYKSLNKQHDSNLFEEFLSEIGQAKAVLDFNKNSSKELTDKIDNLNEKLKTYSYKSVDEKSVLRKIVNYAKEYLPGFEEFSNISEFDKDSLTVKIWKEGDDFAYYMSETGSASNWLAYHLAILLAFHKYFIENNCSCFNFIIFDQPTQAFFPQEIPNNNEKIEEFKNQKSYNTKMNDVESVKKIFELLSKVAYELNEKLQIIVLDHADPKIWGNLDNVYEVEDWSKDNNALIPYEWIYNKK